MLIDRRKKENPEVTKLGTDMAVPDSCLKNVMTMYRQDLKKTGLENAIWGHIGDNHLHVNILARNAEDMEKGHALYKQWAHSIIAMNGTLSAEHGIGKLKAPYFKIMYSKTIFEKMVELKKVFDPAGLLGIGTIFGGGEPL